VGYQPSPGAYSQQYGQGYGSYDSGYMTGGGASYGYFAAPQPVPALGGYYPATGGYMPPKPVHHYPAHRQPGNNGKLAKTLLGAVVVGAVAGAVARG